MVSILVHFSPALRAKGEVSPVIKSPTRAVSFALRQAFFALPSEVMPASKNHSLYVIRVDSLLDMVTAKEVVSPHDKSILSDVYSFSSSTNAKSENPTIIFSENKKLRKRMPIPRSPNKNIWSLLSMVYMLIS